jgi:preprotein translocase subunit YajC
MRAGRSRLRRASDFWQFGAFMFVTPAYAQAAGAAAPGPEAIFIQLLPLIAILVIFYFLLIRPQQKRLKQHRDMIGALRRGDTVVTSGGLIGKITKVADDEVTIELAPGTQVRAVRATISEVRGKGEPAPANDAKA